ncbi:hypothetical protein ABZX77_05800 [Streptomyces sp. NPDC004237]|uniref:hypothetical protein n=1 Tax=Streptomyces sp. NPDC004237 TaxID=3154455 RepID=UPI0033AFE611
MIENTQNPENIKATTLLAFATGDTDTVIRTQERAGQQQVVNSEQLPTDLNGNDRADFETLGFTFGEPDPRDPLFQPATLPDGWHKQGSDHDMWSYILDQLGRRRVAIFYKAAFYDRRAFMRLNTVYGYITQCVYDDAPIVTDDTWATPAVVAAELRRASEHAQKDVTSWLDVQERRGEDETTSRYITEHTAKRDKFVSLAAEFEAASQA